MQRIELKIEKNARMISKSADEVKREKSSKRKEIVKTENVHHLF